MNTQSLIRVLYQSEAVHLAGGAEDFAILDEAVDFNARNDITGFLVRTQTQFFQVLEGRASTVQNLLRRIAVDERNFQLRVIDSFEIEDRLFGGWAMGLKILTPSAAELFAPRGTLSSANSGAIIHAMHSVAQMTS